MKKETVTRVDKARKEFAEMILSRFKDAPYMDELQKGITEILNELNERR